VRPFLHPTRRAARGERAKRRTNRFTEGCPGSREVGLPTRCHPASEHKIIIDTYHVEEPHGDKDNNGEAGPGPGGVLTTAVTTTQATTWHHQYRANRGRDADRGGVAGCVLLRGKGH
jgi:hypothetical protein